MKKAPITRRNKHSLSPKTRKEKDKSAIQLITTTEMCSVLVLDKENEVENLQKR